MSLEERVSQIEQRNQKVESDKAWELSWTRRVLLLVFTYIAIAIYFQVVGVENGWIHAIGASLGFLLSTFSLSFFKDLWVKKVYKK